MGDRYSRSRRLPRGLVWELTEVEFAELGLEVCRLTGELTGLGVADAEIAERVGQLCTGWPTPGAARARVDQLTMQYRDRKETTMIERAVLDRPEGRREAVLRRAMTAAGATEAQIQARLGQGVVEHRATAVAAADGVEVR